MGDSLDDTSRNDNHNKNALFRYSRRVECRYDHNHLTDGCDSRSVCHLHHGSRAVHIHCSATYNDINQTITATRRRDSFHNYQALHSDVHIVRFFHLPIDDNLHADQLHQPHSDHHHPKHSDSVNLASRDNHHDKPV